MSMTLKYDKDALLTLHAQGLSPRQMSRQTGIPRSTIDRYVRDAGQSRSRAKSLTKVSDDGQTLKLCSECKAYKPANDEYFAPHKRGYAGFYSTCRDCKHAKDAAHFTRVKETDALRGKIWRAELRREVIGYYSAGTYSCSCCGEPHIEFLVIDHINGAGNNHRRSINRSGLGFYRWLRANAYPPGFRVLCHNCNAAFGLYGTCPHQTEKLDTAEMAWVPTGMVDRAQEAALLQ